MSNTQKNCIRLIISPDICSKFISGDWDKDDEHMLDGSTWYVSFYNKKDEVLFQFDRFIANSYKPPKEIMILSLYIKEIIEEPRFRPERF